MTHRTCSVPGCDRKYLCKGYCKLHYDRMNRKGTLEDPPAPKVGCDYPGCEKPHKSRGYCYLHYSRLKHQGVLLNPNAQPCSFDGCGREARSKSLCQGHYAQLRKGRELTPIARMTNADRFWSRVNKDGPTVPGHPEMGQCWEWTGTRNHGEDSRYAYGVMSINGRPTLMHRYAFEKMVGPIPDGMLIDHICHFAPCVRPDHLRLASRSENNAYMAGPKSTNKNTGIRNVYLNRKSRTRPYFVMVKDRHFGAFATTEEAESAAKRARAEMFEFPDF